MVVRVERVVDVPAPRETVWDFIADPERRARPISVVERFEHQDDGQHVWHVSLPIPLVDRTIAIETEENARDPPSYVEFVGTSKVLRVVGEHTLVENDGITTLTNRFTVDGKVPGVERFFKRQMDAEFDNLERALKEFLASQDGA